MACVACGACGVCGVACVACQSRPTARRTLWLTCSPMAPGSGADGAIGEHVSPRSRRWRVWLAARVACAAWRAWRVACVACVPRRSCGVAVVHDAFCRPMFADCVRSSLPVADFEHVLQQLQETLPRHAPKRTERAKLVKCEFEVLSLVKLGLFEAFLLPLRNCLERLLPISVQLRDACTIQATPVRVPSHEPHKRHLLEPTLPNGIRLVLDERAHDGRAVRRKALHSWRTHGAGGGREGWGGGHLATVKAIISAALR